MAILEILTHPDPRLREVAKPVEKVDASLGEFIDDLFETMYDAPGVGLAATQVGVAKRVAVMDCSEKHDDPVVLINPEILESDELTEVNEGCLSIPGIEDKVMRNHRVKMRALDRNGEAFEMEAEGLMAQAIQHEIDHLDGKLYIDQLSSLKRDRIRKKLEKAKRR